MHGVSGWPDGEICRIGAGFGAKARFFTPSGGCGGWRAGHGVFGTDPPGLLRACRARLSLQPPLAQDNCYRARVGGDGEPPSFNLPPVGRSKLAKPISGGGTV